MSPIDILLPYYGDAALMRKATESILAQDNQNWRLIVVDDCYPDQSVRHWFEDLTDNRVFYHRNQTNLGANANYRRALSIANAEYTVVMGADDVMLPNYIGLMHEIIAENPGVAMIQPGVSIIDEDDAQITTVTDRVKKWCSPARCERITLHGEKLAASLLRGNWTYFPSLCWHRPLIAQIGFRTELNVVQDLALLLDVVARGGTMVVDPQDAFLYRRHRMSDSAVRTSDGYRFLEEANFFATSASEWRERGWLDAERAARLHITSRLHAALLVPRSLITGQLRAALRLGRHAFSGATTI